MTVREEKCYNENKTIKKSKTTRHETEANEKKNENIIYRKSVNKYGNRIFTELCLT
jgi:hypothetical protein